MVQQGEHTHASAWRGPGRFAGPRQTLAAAALMAGKGPVEAALTSALRGLARARPAIFERLGEARTASFVIAPTELPIVFRLEPDGEAGRVAVRPRGEAGDVVIRGRLPVLLRLFDGGRDADAAFFSREISVTGDTAAVMALHNALEAADLDLVDLPGLAVGGVLAAFAERLPGRSPRR